MRSGELRAALTSHLEAVSANLQAELARGVEVPFELEQHGGGRGGRAALYCYRPLTREFIAAHEPALRALPTSHDATLALADFDGLERYLLAMGVDLAPAGGAARVHTALSVLTEDVFGEQSDFELRAERLNGALARLESSLGAAPSEVTLLATLHGMAIASHELAITGGLRILRADALTGMPASAPAGLGFEESSEALDGDGEHLLVILEQEHDEPQLALERGREALAELLRALRLFGDGRIALGRLGWVRVGDGAWHGCALGAGGRPHGVLLVAPEQEDELRGFCNLIARRAPCDDALAWALRRFELGCERTSALEGLSDHLLALRALLEPLPAEAGTLARRLSSLCATELERAPLCERVEQAIELERAHCRGEAARSAAAEALASELADHLRALLRDLICGHLPADLVELAEEIAAEGAELQPSTEETTAAPQATVEASESGSEEASSPLTSLEQIFSDPRQSEEILDVLI